MWRPLVLCLGITGVGPTVDEVVAVEEEAMAEMEEGEVEDLVAEAGLITNLILRQLAYDREARLTNLVVRGIHLN